MCKQARANSVDLDQILINTCIFPSKTVAFSKGDYLHDPVSILYKSIAGRYRPVRVADGPITAHYRFIKNASWGNAKACFRPEMLGLFKGKNKKMSSAEKFIRHSKR